MTIPNIAMTRRTILKVAGVAAGAIALPGATRAAEPTSTTPPAGIGAGKSILLYSGWATHNIGDVGHTPGTLRYLAQHLPAAKVVCWLRKTNDAVDAMLRKRFSTVDLVRGELANDGTASTPELQKAFDACDMLIQNSGMHFNRFWNPPINLLLASAAKKKRVGLYGQSFDGFRPADEERLAGLLSGASFIHTRDTESLVYLRRLGVASGVLEFGPDGCFGIDVRDDEKAEAWMQANRLESGKFVCVVVRSDSLERFNVEKDDPATAGRIKERIDDWLSRMVEVVTGIVRKGMKVALVPEVEKEIATARDRVLAKLPEDVRKQVVHREAWWNCDEACSLYARAHSLVAMEPHSCIMA
ncbi:MAG TPA: polysaccharide pyruvyl transferase family protein, partial [Tepidisphaeraceae bacterium]|nr:polysaccharide pyruvyl transferase family protein [Tepidisphaeraceae bacterium]